MTLRNLALLVGTALLAGCTIFRLDSGSDPPRIESKGWIRSHVALGIPERDRFIRARLFSGTSDGAIAELAIWKLLRVEVGLLGASVGVGPFHLGLGIFFYDPEVPEMMGAGDEDDSDSKEPETIQLEYEEHPTVKTEGG